MQPFNIFVKPQISSEREIVIEAVHVYLILIAVFDIASQNGDAAPDLYPWLQRSANYFYIAPRISTLIKRKYTV